MRRLDTGEDVDGEKDVSRLVAELTSGVDGQAPLAQRKILVLVAVRCSS